MELNVEWIAFIAIFCGIISRTYFPYLRKLDEYKTTVAGTGVTNLAFNFDIKFILTALFSGIVSAIFVFPLFVAPENASMLIVFIQAFVFAYGTNSIVNTLAN